MRRLTSALVSILALASALAAARIAHGEPGGTSTVYGPTVSQGEAELEYRGAVFHGGGLDIAALHRAEAGYAFTDWWRPALVIQGADLPGENAELTSLALENVFDFTGTRNWPIHFGGYAEYSFGQSGRADAVEFKLLAERRDGPFTARLNLIAERHVGSGASAEWEYGYATRLIWRATERWSMGFEGFGEPEADANYWGPRVGLSFGATSLGFGYLVGIGDSEADGQLRLALEVER